MRKERIFRRTQCFNCLGNFKKRIFFEKFNFLLQGKGIRGLEEK